MTENGGGKIITTAIATTSSTSSGEKRKRGPKNGPQNHHHHLFPLIPLVVSAASAVHSFLSQNDLHLHPSQTLTLESKITSVSLSISKLNSLLLSLNPYTKTLTPPALPLPPPPPSLSSSTFSPISSSPCWFQRFLSAASDQSDPRWVEAFRMSKPSFILLLQTLAPSFQNSTSKIPPDYMLASALFRLAHGSSFKSVGRRFGIDSAAACRSFYEVCKAVNDRLGHFFEFSPNDLSRIIVGFGWISLPNCCGVLGFSKFPVESEKNKDDDYDDDDDTAVIVQCLVDSEGRFLDVSAGWPSKMNPPTILQHSKLFSRVGDSKDFLNGPSFEFRDGNSIPQYILGDSCCPLLPWLLTPYPISDKVNGDDNLHTASLVQVFNSVHSRGMKLVDTALGSVRTRWQLLSMKWKEESVESYPFVIVAGCLLHNFLLNCSEPLPYENERNFLVEQDEFPVFEGTGNENAQRIRYTLALQLAMASHRI